MPRLFYFAYGSNLHPARMRARVPSARAVCRADLRGFSLAFHKRGADGSGKCTLQRRPGSLPHVLGVVYALDPNERPRLDALEGGYRGHWLQLRAGHDARPLWAFSYVAETAHVDARLRPFSWYRALVVGGARAHGLPRDYVRWLARTAAVADPDRRRHRRERAQAARWYVGPRV